MADDRGRQTDHTAPSITIGCIYVVWQCDLNMTSACSRYIYVRIISNPSHRTVLMRREGKGTGQMTDPQCMVHTLPATATGTYTVVVCQTKHRHRPSCKFLPP